MVRGCRNRRCLDPLLPSNVSSSLKCSPADESSPRRLSSSAVSDSNNDSCKDLSFDGTLSSDSRHSVVEATSKISSPGRIVADESGNGSSKQLTPSTCRRRSQKFTDSTTWSRFRQQRAAALNSRSVKVFVWQMFVEPLHILSFLSFVVEIVHLEQRSYFFE